MINRNNIHRLMREKRLHSSLDNLTLAVSARKKIEAAA